MTTVEMTAGIIDGSRYDTVRYPGDEILLRVTEGGNVQVVEYFSTDRDGRPYDGMARELAALYPSGQVDSASIVAIANRHGVRLEGDDAH